MYTVKEIFYSLQGEGARSGRPAVFCRFSGCNAWSGREQDKADSACPFCDTDFVGINGQNGGKYETKALVEKILSLWPEDNNAKAKPYIVFTGGEPLLQLDDQLVQLMKANNFEVAVETNGSLEVPEGIDWICVSPKKSLQQMVVSGQELKLLYPQTELLPELFIGQAFDHFFLQAIDDENYTDNVNKTVDYCLNHPQWSYSFQLHKLLKID
ncbi:MAG: 7-carboxy-7-deazaguanine synthase [Gammaproteobacteria bacterium]|nr:7-carboxy-7-deazaguanine synthase [Gammaproteobacteria bacterium]